MMKCDANYSLCYSPVQMVYGWVDAIRTSTELIPFVHYENSSLTDEKYDEILRLGCP